MTSPFYTADDDDGRAQRIRNAEARFYRAALPVLLSQPGNQELRQTMAQRDALKSLGAQ